MTSPTSEASGGSTEAPVALSYPEATFTRRKGERMLSVRRPGDLTGELVQVRGRDGAVHLIRVTRQVYARGRFPALYAIEDQPDGWRRSPVRELSEAELIVLLERAAKKAKLSPYDVGCQREAQRRIAERGEAA